MSQDTRKDKRAKVVSLNVRYKSATVDEFIENHSHDVSKGGLFVKTPTPFPPGTLLKFEIRLAGDKSVISGVGRVVWKREPTQAGAEKPAGMGVKFIKIDDSSRAIIDRLITQKADAGSAYTSETPVEEAPGHPSTLRGLVAAAGVESGRPPGPSPTPVNVPAPTAAGRGMAKLPVPPPVAPDRPAPAPDRKNLAVAGTLPGPRPTGLPSVPPAPEPRLVPPPAPSSKGVGTDGARGAKPPPRPAPAAAGKPPSSPTAPAAMAPADKPSSDPKLGAPPPPPRPLPPGRKATMLGMGIASTPPPPNTDAAPAPGRTAATPSRAEPMFPPMDPESGNEPARGQTVMKQAAELLEEALKEAGGSLDEIGQNPLFTQTGEATADAPMSKRGQIAPIQSGDTMIMAALMPSASPSSPPADGRDVTALTPFPGLGEASSVRAGSSPSQPLILDAAPATSPRTLGAELEAAKKKGGGAGILIALLLLVMLLAGGGVVAWQTGMLAGLLHPPSTPTTPLSSTASSTAPPPSSPPSAASAASLTTADAAIESTDASAASTTAEGGVADAGKDSGKVGTATGENPPKPPPRPYRPPPPRPPPTAVPVETTEVPTSTPTPAPTPAPTKDPANEP